MHLVVENREDAERIIPGIIRRRFGLRTRYVEYGGKHFIVVPNGQTRRRSVVRRQELTQLLKKVKEVIA